MCGFIGTVNQTIPNFTSFVKKLSHRGPDEQGIYEDKKVQLGFRRLSIIDLKNGSQPFFSKDRRYALIFNGEIYNYKYLRKILQNKGIRFTTQSDTEVLLEGLIFWGNDCLTKINGMFAFALYDFKKEELTMARDRFGIKPLYYSLTNNHHGIVYSSEIKILIKTKVVEKTVNLNAISSYLSFRYPYGVGNFFDKIEKVEPGEVLVFNNGNIKKKKYWKIPLIHETKDSIKEKVLLEELENILDSVVKDHLESDVSIGSLLSGGLDSSLITTMMNKYQKNFNTYSASFDNEGYDENDYAKMVSNQIGSNHTNITLNSKNYFESLDKIIEHKYLPLYIPHEVALFDLFKNIKSTNKVVISGEGADEMFGGYGRVQGAGFDYKKIKYFNSLGKFLGKKNVFNYFNAKKIFTNENLSRKDHFYKIYNWFTMDEKAKILSDKTYNEINKDKKSEIFWENEFDEISNMDENNKFIYLFQKFHLQCLLDRLDLISMAHSVEARVPFCDHRITTFLSTVPYKYKIKWKSTFSKIKAIFSLSDSHSERLNDSKYILRKISTKYIPDEITKRKKLGFPVPLDAWLTNGKDKKFIKEILLDDQTKKREIFNINEVENLINNKENLSYDFWGKKIWMLLNIEIWLRKINE